MRSCRQIPMVHQEAVRKSSQARDPVLDPTLSCNHHSGRSHQDMALHDHWQSTSAQGKVPTRRCSCQVHGHTSTPCRMKQWPTERWHHHRRQQEGRINTTSTRTRTTTTTTTTPQCWLRRVMVTTGSRDPPKVLTRPRHERTTRPGGRCRFRPRS